MSMEVNSLACDWQVTFSCSTGKFQIPCCLHFTFLKSCCVVPVVEFLSLRDSLNQYFWEVCASSFPQLWFHIARLEEQYSFKATCVFSHSLATLSTVLRIGFGNWAALETKTGEIYSFIIYYIWVKYTHSLYINDIFISSAIISLILHLYCTPADKEDQEYHKVVEQQTLSQSHDFYGLDFQIPSCSMLVGCCYQVFAWRCW